MIAKVTKQTTVTKQTKVPEALKNAMEKINKKQGWQAVRFMTDVDYVQFYSTGIPSFDFILGWGLPKGRVVEFYGENSSGKTTLAIHCAKKMQELGKYVLFVDMEKTFSKEYAETLGLREDLLIYIEPSIWEEAFAQIEEMVKSGAIGLVVYDSVAATTTAEEMESQLEDQKIALVARLFSRVLKKLISLFSQTDTTLLLINQTRVKIGWFSMYGIPEDTAGGKAIKFYCSQRIKITRWEALKDNKELVGYKIKLTIEKNKVASPKKETVVDFFFNSGIDSVADIFTALKEMGIISKAGAYFSLDYNGKTIKTCGAVDFIEALRKIKFEELNKFYQEKALEYVKNHKPSIWKLEDQAEDQVEEEEVSNDDILHDTNIGEE